MRRTPKYSVFFQTVALEIQQFFTKSNQMRCYRSNQNRWVQIGSRCHRFWQISPKEKPWVESSISQRIQAVSALPGIRQWVGIPDGNQRAMANATSVPVPRQLDVSIPGQAVFPNAAAIFSFSPMVTLSEPRIKLACLIVPRWGMVWRAAMVGTKWPSFVQTFV